MSQTQQQQPQAAAPGGLVVFEGFNGLDTQPSRYGVDAKKCFVMDGFFPAGESNARIVPNTGPALGSFNAFGGTVILIQFVTVPTGRFAVVFTSDGAVWSFNTDTSVSTLIAGPATIENPSQQAIGVSQWGVGFVLIVAQQANGYFIWDGTTFYTPGTAVPGFTTVPFGIGGSTVETFGGYVWVGRGAALTWSAPGSITDFATGDGGGSLTSNDSTLIFAYVRLKQSNGYLFLFGDSSIFYIAGVTTTGVPPVTSFSLQNVDPEVGTVWPWTVQAMGSNIVFGNGWGVHASFGGRAAKVSSALDGIYNSQIPQFSVFVPSSTKAILFGKRVWCMLFPITDQFTMQPAFKMMIWDEKQWCTTPQSAALIFVAAQEINSLLFAWGTDGTHLFRLFFTADTRQNKVLQSKYWAPNSYATNKTENRLWGLIQLFSGSSASLDISIDSEMGTSPKTITIGTTPVEWLNNLSQVVPWTNTFGALVTWTSGGGNGNIVIPPNFVGQQGALVGFTVVTDAQDLALISLATMPVDAGYRG